MPNSRPALERAEGVPWGLIPQLWYDDSKARSPWQRGCLVSLKGVSGMAEQAVASCLCDTSEGESGLEGSACATACFLLH